MFKIACNHCGTAVSSHLPNATVFGGAITCGPCVKKKADEQLLKINATISSRNELVWHLGIFEDIGLDSGMDMVNRFRVAALTRRLNEIIPDEDLSESFIDVGCNCGQFLRQLWIRGARNLIGTEPRQVHLDFAQWWVEKEDAFDIEWECKPVEEVPKEDLDGKIVLALGLVYHLPDPDAFFAQMKASDLKYCLLESQTFEDETFVNEGTLNLQHGISADDIWHPTVESIEAMLDKHGFKWKRIEYTPGMDLSRGLWKFWKEGGTSESSNSVATATGESTTAETV